MYYKNVAKQYASLALSPFAQLAMTRSIGDCLVACHQPTIQQFSLSSLLSGSTICIVCSTDGVWDNWIESDVAKFVLDDTCMAVLSDENGVQRVVDSFIARNVFYARRNFGPSRDNATACVIYIKKD